MASPAKNKRILLIDRQDYWRALSAEALTRAGFIVDTVDNYAYPPPNGYSRGAEPHLVILGCASIGTQERMLISKILEYKHHLLVLSTSLPWKMMRSLFLAGADDVADKPYDPDQIVTVVEQALAGTTISPLVKP